jgi:hypothetical protein
MQPSYKKEEYKYKQPKSEWIIFCLENRSNMRLIPILSYKIGYKYSYGRQDEYSYPAKPRYVKRGYNKQPSSYAVQPKSKSLVV